MRRISAILIIVLLFVSCKNNNEKERLKRINAAIEHGDTALSKELAQKELQRLRSSIADSSFANMTDISLKIQELEFVIREADPATGKPKTPADLIVHSPDGQLLYNLVMKLYQSALMIATRESDKEYFNRRISLNADQWLKEKFDDKTLNEVSVSLHLLQKDVALVSMIRAGADTEQNRADLNKQYNDITAILQKRIN